jgi:prophage regulatory protein
MERKKGPRLVRLPEVRDRLGVCSSTVYGMIAEGKFPRPIKHGRMSFWKESDLEAKIFEITGESGPFSQGP